MSTRFEVITTPSSDGKITLEVNSLTEDKCTQIIRRVLDTQDLQIRKALIRLGWTPPTDTTPGV